MWVRSKKLGNSHKQGIKVGLKKALKATENCHKTDFQ